MSEYMVSVWVPLLFNEPGAATRQLNAGEKETQTLVPGQLF